MNEINTGGPVWRIWKKMSSENKCYSLNDQQMFYAGFLMMLDTGQKLKKLETREALDMLKDIADELEKAGEIFKAKIKECSHYVKPEALVTDPENSIRQVLAQNFGNAERSALDMHPGQPDQIARKMYYAGVMHSVETVRVAIQAARKYGESQNKVKVEMDLTPVFNGIIRESERVLNDDVGGTH